MKRLIESLDYMDMEGQLDDVITVDEYSAKMGKDSDIVTLTFIINSEQAAKDLTSWFERGYDFVLDASVSDGELEPGKYLVFVEMRRRSTVPDKICQLLEDLETLTGMKMKDWKVSIEDEEYDADPKVLADHMILNPNQYKMEKETEEDKEDEKEDKEEETEETEDEDKLNEFRIRAGIEPSKVVYENDEYIMNLKAMAGM
jgi:hypothetical protein